MIFRRRKSSASILLLTFLATTFIYLQSADAQNCATCLSSALGFTSTSTSNSVAVRDSVFVGAADLGDPWIIRKRVDEVTVFFTATKGHKYVDDLTENEVSVKDDNHAPAKISAFGHQSDLPLRLGLLVDTSNSVHYRFSFEQEASSRFLQKIVRVQMDRAFVVGFSDHSKLVQDFTDSSEKLAHAISALRSDGGTAIFDAVRTSCRKLSHSADQGPTARILVLISDGDDNASKSSLEQAIETAQREEVTIYTISTNNSGYTRPGDRVLKDLALQTGGQTFSPNSAKEMVKAFSAIEDEMRSRYALAYQPADLHEDGRFHRIEIRAQKLNKKLHVHARKGYYAPLAMSDTQPWSR
jgi:Ca-activated chloride channel homolog